MGRKRTVPAMTASDFVATIGALGGNHTELAYELGISPSTISCYKNGTYPVPQRVADKLADLLHSRADEFIKRGALISKPALSAVTPEFIGKLLVASNEEALAKLRAAPPPVVKLERRHDAQDASTYPSYRLRLNRMQVFAGALAGYAQFIREQRLSTASTKAVRGFDLELADLKVLAAQTKGMVARGAPYDITISRAEWLVISRALRHSYTQGMQAAYALYQHWRIHKPRGYKPVLVHRSTPPTGVLK